MVLKSVIKNDDISKFPSYDTKYIHCSKFVLIAFRLNPFKVFVRAVLLDLHSHTSNCEIHLHF